MDITCEVEEVETLLLITDSDLSFTVSIASKSNDLDAL